MGIKKNFAFNSILSVSGYVFPLITYPYISRVLGVSNIGICNFIDGIVNYFVVFSMLGISATGIREIAKNRYDQVKLSKVFSSLFLLNLIATCIAILLLLITTFSFPQLRLHKEMMFIGAAKLLFNLFLAEWFFTGIENFKYITIRSLIVKIIFVCSVFLFVNEPSDYKIYYGLLVLVVVINAVFNWRYRRKFVRISFKNPELNPYLKSFFTIGIYLLLTSMYTYFNIAFLGFVSGETEVGYYTTATKLYRIFLSFFTAFTAVMLPRMSSLVAKGDISEVKRLTFKSYDALLTFSLPIIIIVSVFAPQIINILVGKGYEGAILPMRIVIPLMLVIGIEQILILQLLMPLKKDKIILINSIVGASVGILLNILLVPIYKSVGSAIVWVFAELAVLITAQFFVKRKLEIGLPVKKIIVSLLVALPMLVFCIGIQINSSMEPMIKLIVAGLICGVYYLVMQIFVLKNELLFELLDKVKLRTQKY